VSAPPVWGLLLAAGEGQRFRAAGGGDKLLHLIEGEALVLASAQRLRAALMLECGDQMRVVLRPGSDALQSLLEARGFEVFLSPTAERGMGASLASAMSVLPADAAFMVALADMPFIAVHSYARVRDALREGASIVQPRYQGQPGHPVGFAARWRAELAQLDGDTGARGLLHSHGDQVLKLALDDPGILRDIDLPTQLADPG